MTTEETVKQMLAALQIEVPDERLAPLAKAYDSTLAQAASIRAEQTPQPTPSAFDASWEAQS